MKKKLLIVLFAISVPLFIMLLSYKLTMRYTELTPEQQNVLTFLEEKGTLSVPFTSAEISHLEDVKHVMNKMDFLFYFLLLILTLIIVYYEQDTAKIVALFRWGGIVTIVGMGILVFLFYVQFESAFVMFHTIFFPQGNWMFPSDSLLIQTFPFSFFMSLGRMIVVQSLVWGIVFIAGSLFFRYARKN
ncbi:MAG: DUF1461 domain-containing protein [Nanoarchaeota archaeon]